MQISPGQNLLHYRVVEKIGQGGMGEVWRATDTTLSRDVAIKTLPEAVSGVADRLQRFEREARLLAALNHPNIASVYGLHEAEGVHFLVMELVDGEDLAQRLARGPLPVSEALAVARQVAEGLQAAHDSGVIHRDLKPANVKVTPDGQAKVLDFGLAKAASPTTASGESQSASLSPTLTTAGTAAGIIMGTAAYMSPEQARGKSVDRRSDIWALGCLLYEMLTGVKLFTGETISDILAAVLRAEPDWDLLPQETPAAARRLLRRCLQRDPADRLHDIADARLEIRDAEAGEGEPQDTAAHEPARRGAAIWMLPVIGLAGLAAGLLWNGLREPVAAPARSVQASLLAPEGTWLDNDTSPAAGVLSPDGSRVVFGAVNSEDLVSRLHVRNLTTGKVEVLQNTEDAQYPFWSPDSHWVAFFTVQDTSLKKINPGGGPAITICAAQNGKGGSWSKDGTILFAPSFGSTIHKVAATGGESGPVTTMDTSKHNSHRHPRFLADGEHFVFLARSNVPSEPSSILMGSINNTEVRELMRSTSQVELARDHLFFVRQSTLLAQPFDAAQAQLIGDPVALADGVRLVPGASYAAFNTSGADVIYNGAADEQQVALEWWDTEGNSLSVLGDPGYLASVTLSPDERQAAMVLQDGSGGSLEIWTVDLARGLATRLTTEAGDQYQPKWSADSNSVLYASNHQDGKFSIYRRRVGGVESAEVLLSLPETLSPVAMAADQSWMAYARAMPDGLQLWLANLGPEGYEEGHALLSETYMDLWSTVSPDGRWFAYSSAVEGRSEAYLTRFPEADRRWRVSSNGGLNPTWRQDGKQLVFQQPDGQIMSSTLTPSGDDPGPGRPEPLFRLRRVQPWGSPAVPMSDGKRFLVIPTPEENTGAMHLVLNWPERLKSR